MGLMNQLPLLIPLLLLFSPLISGMPISFVLLLESFFFMVSIILIWDISFLFFTPPQFMCFLTIGVFESVIGAFALIMNSKVVGGDWTLATV